jgi:F0F1-type ATP synthase assembly protein I
LLRRGIGCCRTTSAPAFLPDAIDRKGEKTLKSTGLLGSGRSKMLQVQNQQILAVLKIQAVVTLAGALALGGLGGLHWGVSGLLGGLVSLAAGLTYGIVISRIVRGSAERALLGALRAEAAKILVIVVGLWSVFATYDKVFGVGFIGVFVLTTVVFSFAVFIRVKK